MSIRAAVAAEGPLVQTTYGPVVGLEQGEIRIFRGIPFAAPPVGPLRWRPPVPPTPWQEPRPTREFGPSCPQARDRIVPAPRRQSEDCLYLNVWSPREAARLPVMIFIHGGGFSKGSSSQMLYDSPALAREGVVLVTINYRLGVFGFFCHPALTAESPEHTCGNYGLLDQVAALRWVHDNIAAFGGDPGRVTIFGESAGAVSAALLMASPLARGLFHGAILESGSVPRRLSSRAQLEQEGVQRQHDLGIPAGPEALRRLREVKAEQLLVSGAGDDTLPGAGIRSLLCVDGRFLTEPPAETFRAHRQMAVPVIVGSNADEGTLWSRRLPVKSVARRQAMLRLPCRDEAAAAAALYPVRTEAELQPALDDFLGDPFIAGARRLARYSAPLQPRTYLYHFTRRGPMSQRSGLGAFHGSELMYVFGSFPRQVPVPPEDEALAESIRRYWTNFAKSADPNAADLPSWPAYTVAEDRHLALDVPTTEGAHLKQARCDLWDRLQE